jgi:hypothetical protein
MIEVHQVEIVTPLTMSASAFLGTVFIHALALGATVDFFRRETRSGRTGV